MIKIINRKTGEIEDLEKCKKFISIKEMLNLNKEELKKRNIEVLK